MILCDTNILIEFYKGNVDVTHVLKTVGASNLGISVVTAAELYYGARDKRELRRIQKQLALIHQAPLNTEISALFINLLENYVLSHGLNIPDALIAATALHYGWPLYTLNIKDFQYIPNISLYAA